MTQDITKPSLENAYARAARARQHLTQFKRNTTKFLAKMPPVLPSIETDLAEAGIVIGHFGHLVPSKMNILVGECIYNLRAALDYLIFELAILDSEQVQKKTQFLIADKPKGWKQRVGSELKGLTSEHKAAIEYLQPYNGCDWTKVLRDISNPDKHRHLVLVQADNITEWTLRTYSQPDTSAPLNPVRMHAEVSYFITFSDGRPVMKTLQELHEKVVIVLDKFNPEFQKKILP